MVKRMLKIIVLIVLLTGCRELNKETEENIIENYNEYIPYIDEDIKNNEGIDDEKNTSLSTETESSKENMIPDSVLEFYDNNLMWISCCSEKDYFWLCSSFSYYSDKYNQTLVVSGIDSGLFEPVNRYKKLKAICAGKVQYENVYNSKEASLKNYINYNGTTEESEYTLAFTVKDNEALELSSLNYTDINEGDKIYLVASGHTYPISNECIIECYVENVCDSNFTFLPKDISDCDSNSGGILLSANGDILGVHVFNKNDKCIAYKIKNIIEDIESGSISESEYPDDYDPYAYLDYKEYGEYKIYGELVNKAPFTEIYIKTVEFSKKIGNKEAPANYRFAIFDINLQYYVDVGLFRLGKNKEYSPCEDILMDEQLVSGDEEANWAYPYKNGKIIFIVPDDMDFENIISYEDNSMNF